MGQTLSFSAKPIEIKAPPAVVRAVVRIRPKIPIRRKDPDGPSLAKYGLLTCLTLRLQFLNFDSYPKWKPGWSVVPAEAGKKPLDLKKGDLIQVNMDGKVHHPRVVVSS